MHRDLEIPQVIFDRESVIQSSGQCDCSGDCACSVFMAENKSDYLFSDMRIGSTSWRRGSDSHVLELNDSHLICFSPQHRATVLNRSAFDLLSDIDESHHFDQIGERWGDEVIQATVQQMLAVGLLVPEDYVPPTAVERSSTLSAWLHITDRCNLRCSYCYLPHERVDMSLETGRAAIDATFRSALAHDYGQVKLKYAGGEAMIRFPFIAELHRYAHKQAREHGLALDGVVLSNGTLLTEEIIETMQALNLRLMISLDGLGETHDRQRPFAGGHGSSRAVVQAVDLALAHDLIPDISITISGRNIDGLPELISWVLERDLPFSLNFYRENDLSMSQVDLQLEEQKIIDGMLAAYQVIEENLSRRNLLASLVDFANLSAAHLRTCNVGTSYLVFDYQGRVAKCQMQLNQPITTVHAPDPLSLIRADQIGIQNLSVEEKEGCRTCEWKYWCTGGCPLATYRATGRYDVKSPNCNIYKALYPAAMRLEGLRLLKYS